jgi:L-ascorbate metabolism protein UlaG (beta-lactamase superfamily)
MKFTFYGHACFAVEVQGKKIVFDPFITPNELAKSVDPSTIEADYIFVSHGHYDHIADLVTLARRTNATVVASFEVIEWAKKQGLTKVHPMNLGGKWAFDFGTVKCVNAIHSSELPDGSYGGAPMGFVFRTNDGNFYFAGDTALTFDMQLIPRFAKLDFAVLPVGDNLTMGVEDAIITAEFVECNRIVGVHYDTFGFIKIDKDKVAQQFADAGLELFLPAIGSSIEL